MEAGSAADRAGARAGDRIISIDDQPVQSASHLTQVIANIEPHDEVEIEVGRWQVPRLDATLRERPSAAARFRYFDDEEPVPEAPLAGAR